MTNFRMAKLKVIKITFCPNTCISIDQKNSVRFINVQAVQYKTHQNKHQYTNTQARRHSQLRNIIVMNNNEHHYNNHTFKLSIICRKCKIRFGSLNYTTVWFLLPEAGGYTVGLVTGLRKGRPRNRWDSR